MRDALDAYWNGDPVIAVQPEGVATVPAVPLIVTATMIRSPTPGVPVLVAKFSVKFAGVA
jgi:hypothetical protein